MNSTVTLVIIMLMIIVATYTVTSASAIEQGKSMINTSICTKDKPCHNSTTVCTGNSHPCSITKWNSTSSDEIVAETE
jgi:hypothetical protein